MGETLLVLAETEGIVVIRRDLQRRHYGILGMYVRTKRATGIAIDQDLRRQPRLERCVLAHELGHHFTGATTGFWQVGYPFTVSRDDRRALHWAVDLLVPTRPFLRRSGSTHWELAEEFQVIESFIDLKMEFLHRDEQFMRKFRVG